VGAGRGGKGPARAGALARAGAAAGVSAAPGLGAAARALAGALLEIPELDNCPEPDKPSERALDNCLAQVDNERHKFWDDYGLNQVLNEVEALGISEAQLRRAEALLARGLQGKAKRHAHCGLQGVALDCTNTECGLKLYRPYRCRNRYCPSCGPRDFQRLAARYAGLAEVAERLVPGWEHDPHYKSRPTVIAKLDVTVRNLGRMPTNEEVRLFNKLVRRLLRRAERELKLPKGSWGAAWCDEFGGKNSNLHAHGVYAGPFLPQAKLSAWWRELCAGTVFHGSYIVSIKRARSFQQALNHALKYPAKYVSRSDPERLAELELAFNGVRRLHTLGAFYRFKTEKEVAGNGPVCPRCGAAMREDGRKVTFWCQKKKAWRTVWFPNWKALAELRDESEGRLSIEEYRHDRWLRRRHRWVRAP
jgi:ribosomal protein S27AE